MFLSMPAAVPGPRRAPIMPGTMEPLRRTRHMARLMLACFAMALGAAMLSPLVHARGMERVCSAADGPRWVARGGDAAATHDGHGLECALCLPSMLPPAAAQAPAAPRGLAAPRDAAPPRQAHAPPLSRAPFPPRAPPAQS